MMQLTQQTANAIFLEGNTQTCKLNRVLLLSSLFCVPHISNDLQTNHAAESLQNTLQPKQRMKK